MTSANNQDTDFLKDFNPGSSLRVQDKTMVDWLKNLRYRKSNPTVVTAWMSKQFASKKELHSDKKQLEAMPYPMISLSVGRITPDLERRQVNDVRGGAGGVAIHVDPSDTTSERVIIPYPSPISIPYTVDIWTKTRQDLRWLESALMERMVYVDETYLKATFPGYGEMLLRLVWDGTDDTSDLETEDAQKDRELRKTVSFNLDGWLLRTPKKVKPVLNASVAFIDASDGLLDDQDFLDHYCDIDTNYNFDSDGAITNITEDPLNTPPNRVLLWVSYDETGLIGTGSQA